ncbi:MAG: hypothetical protein HOP19_28790 [Acidobacteria bacterium]|nr:hypothetical protein [Acidobacteriota bacterium]
MKKTNGTALKRPRKSAPPNETEWLRVREFERRLSELPAAEQEAFLQQLSFEEVYALFCATVAKNAEAGRYAEAR